MDGLAPAFPSVQAQTQAQTVSGPRTLSEALEEMESLRRQPPSSLWSLPPLMAILRGLACSATGIRSLSTPAS